MTVTRRIRRRGEHEISRKTIARGMPVDPSEPVVNTLVCFVLFRTRGCGCSGHPAFPAPSEFEGRMLLGKNSRGCAARSRSCVRKGCYLTIESVTVIPRHRHSGFDASHRPGMTNVEVFPSLRANGSRECAPDDKLREAIQLSARQVWIASSLCSSQRRKSSQRGPAIFAVGEARFLQIEIAFDPPPDLVGDLAVAQQDVDEFPLRCNQLSRQFHPRG